MVLSGTQERLRETQRDPQQTQWDAKRLEGLQRNLIGPMRTELDSVEPIGIQQDLNGANINYVIYSEVCKGLSMVQERLRLIDSDGLSGFFGNF